MMVGMICAFRECEDLSYQLRCRNGDGGCMILGGRGVRMLY